MRRKDQLALLVGSRCIQEQPNELLRKLRMKRIFEFVDQVDPGVLSLSRPVENGQQVEITDATVGFLLEGQPKPLVSIPMHGDKTLIDNMFILCQASAENGATLRIEVRLRGVIEQLSLDLIKDFFFCRHLCSRHLYEADVGDARVSGCQPLPNSGTKILIVRDLLRHEDVTRSPLEDCQALKPFDDGAQKTLLIIDESRIEAGFEEEAIWLHRLRRRIEGHVVLKIAIERDLLAAAFKDRLLIFRAHAIEGLFDDFSRVERHLVVDDSLAIRRHVLHIEDDFNANDAGPVGTEEKVRVIVQALPTLTRLAQHDLQVGESIEESRFPRRIRTVDRSNGKHAILAAEVEGLSVAAFFARNHRKVDRFREALPVVKVQDSQHRTLTFPLRCKNSTSSQE